MFCFEWNEKEEREALLEAGETRGKLKILKHIMAKNNWPAEKALMTAVRSLSFKSRIKSDNAPSYSSDDSCS